MPVTSGDQSNTRQPVRSAQGRLPHMRIDNCSTPPPPCNRQPDDPRRNRDAEGGGEPEPSTLLLIRQRFAYTSEPRFVRLANPPGSLYYG